jgi:hypothetical protein
LTLWGITRRRPTDGLLDGNEFALHGSMGKSPRHIVRVARLIKANMTQRVTRVPEVYEHEAALCHAFPHKIEFEQEAAGSGEPSLLHTGLFGLDRRTRDRAVRTEHTTIAGFCL